MNDCSRRTIVRGITIGLAGAWLAAAQDKDIVRVGDSEIEVTFSGAAPDLPRADILAWVKQCATGVAGYFGRFPVAKARIAIGVREGRSGVAGARTWGEGGAHTRISVGQKTDVSGLRHDWVMTHEMVHYGFPDMPPRYHWIEEGMATYIEPIARVAIGTQDSATAWFEMVRDMPQGLPKSGDEGLDNTHTWGRTYWGGAIFCLLADIKIHQQTGNAKGLRDAFRAVVKEGGNIEVNWPLERALEIGDHAVGGTPLTSLYQELATKSVPVDLDQLWKDLGVKRQRDTAVFDDQAPQAAIRRAILA